MNDRHAADLIWRFGYEEGRELAAPSALAVLADTCASGAAGSREQACASTVDAWLDARARARRIDAALARLRVKPVRLARVLLLRYGANDGDAGVRQVLREVARVAEVTAEAAAWATRSAGKPPRPRSHDVQAQLAVLCRQITSRQAGGEERIAIDEIRRGAESLVGEAERAYEASAGGMARSRGEGEGMGKTFKSFYTGPELARALGISRWSMRRWLEARQIPFELHRRPGATRGGRIVVMVADLRTFAPSYFASMREGLVGEGRGRGDANT